METLVINARLEMPPATPASPQVKPPETPADPVTRPVVEKPPEAAAAVKTPPLLTSNVPSPTPPLPLAPVPLRPVEAKPPQVVPAAVPAAMPSTAAAPPPGPAPHPGVTSTPLSIGIDPTWYIARQVDVPAHAVGSVVPAYPEQARRRSQEGTLKLMLKIDDLGRVRDVEVVEADIPGVFDEAALEAFRNARFQPAMKDGRPVRYQAYIRVVFKLRD